MAFVLFVVAAVLFCMNALKNSTIDGNWPLLFMTAGLAVMALPDHWFPFRR